ncbi:MAG: heat-inducible transcription repressor HrcA [Clostridiales bacterium]|nr:heat-inducible transcription repressor HrcA [Clostridiales bacterium]
MDLSLRQMQILQAIINDYVQTAEPVGSRAIAKKHDFGISPATIRNEMSDLEELGYLTHPHTSAGRVPSDKAYRLYVNQLMKKKNLTSKEKRIIREKLSADRSEFESTIKHAAELLSEITHLTSFAMTPAVNQDTLNFIKLIPVDERAIVLMIVSNGGVITNTTLRLNVPYTMEGLEILSKTMTLHYKDSTVDEVLKNSIIDDIGTDIEAMSALAGNVMPNFMRTVEDMLNVNLYMEGLTNIFSIPEYSSIDKARAFLEMFNRKDVFAKKMLEREDGVIVTIGTENMTDLMKDCSLITATYHVDGNLAGKIGIIGPTRMKYDEVTSIMEYLTSNLSESFKLSNGKETDNNDR